jgi:oligopeptide transport system substrate-binding protein
MKRVLAVGALAAVALAACGDAEKSATDGGGGPRKSSQAEIPRHGEDLKNVDWASFFPAGDAWRKQEQVLVWNNDAEPETLDPALMTGVTEHNLALALFEGLTSHHPATLQPIPGVAEWWEASKDGLVYTFHLRADAKWSNGDPVTAEDFRWSWRRALTPAICKCEYAEMFYAIRGAEDFYLGKLKSFDEVGVAAPDPRTLKVTLRSPTAYFLDLTTFETLMPVHRATVEKFGDQWTQPEHFVGNGPFAMTAWKPRASIEMAPNEHWWNRAIVRLSKMVVRAIDDQNTSLSEYLSGGLDWIRSIPARRIDEAQQHPDYYVSPYLGTYFFRFNTTKKPFDDVRVRKAFNLATDKKAICEKVLKAGQTPATTVVPASMIPGYPVVKGDAYDPARARVLLAEAGYPEGRGFPDVEVLYNTSESHKAVCEQLVDMWKSNLGVKVQLANREWKVYLEDTRNLNYQIQRAGWIADFLDAFTFLDMWVEGRGNNNTGWANAKYKDLLSRASVEVDPAKRLELFAEAEKILCLEDLPILPVYYYVNQGMLRPRVRGWHENVLDLHPFQYMYLDGK